MAVLFWLCFVLIFDGTFSRDVHFYVSPTGSDSNNGSSTQFPLRKISKAFNYAQRWTYNGSDNLYIELMQGYHDLDDTVRVGLHHGKQLTIRSYKNQPAYVTGGRRIPANKFHRVTNQGIKNALPRAARNHVRYVNLPSLSITDYGKIQQWGFHAHRSAPLEVFENGQPYRMAQWPNKGYINVVGVPDGRNGLRFQYNSTRPTTWRYTDELWAYGFWSHGWADRSAKVASIDTRNMIVTLENGTTNLLGIATGHWGGQGSEGGYFKFFNVLSELDEPGEYYLDQKTGNLYVWFMSGHSNDVIHVSMVKNCFDIGITKNVVFSNFVVEICRDRGITGINNKNLQITNMEVRNTGDWNLYLGGDCRGISITKNKFHDGDGGVWVSGGNRKLLQSSGNVVEDNEIYNYTRVAAIGKDGIRMYGVGQLTRYNNIHSGSNVAIRYYGNDHVIEYNNIHYICVDVTYCAAIYADGDLTFRGIKIRYNHVHNVTRNAPGSHVFAVMLNHKVSAAAVTNNVFYNNEVHVFIAAGRDNVIEGNVMYNATAYSMSVNGQGRGRVDTNLIKNLHAVPYTGPLWKAKYPKLAAIDSYNYTLPEGNQIHKNLVYNAPKLAFINGMNDWLDSPQYYNVSMVGFSNGPEDYYNTKIGDLRLRCHAAAWANQVGFQQVVTPNDVGPRYDVGPSFSKIGHKTTRLSNNPGSCPKLKPPNNNPPMPAYPPDGSGQPPIFKTFNEGCWLHLDKCANDTKAIGTYRDMIGERYFHAADNETMCFKRGYEQWKFCGSKANELVGVAYGPTDGQLVARSWCCVCYGASNVRNIRASTQFPLRTISRAFNYARRPTYNGSDNLYIELMQGYHDLDNTVPVGQHHGKMLTIRSYNGQTVYVTGGRQIPAKKFHRVTDQGIKNALPRAARSHVRVVNLPSLNITDYGKIQQWGFHAYRSAPLEVFENGQPYRMAQWPNKGYINVVGVPDGKNGLRFQYNSTRPTTWRYTDELWAYGFWSHGWADKSAKVTSLDTKNMIVTIANGSHHLLGITTGHWGGEGREGGYFKFFNVLSELDEPGEYYLDQKTGNLYVWFMSGHSNDVIHVSMVKNCFDISVTRNLAFSNFVIEICRDRGITGINNRNIQITNMEIRNTGDLNINLGGDSRGISITKSKFHDGDGGVAVSGGNRKLLQSSGNVVEENEIYNYTRAAAIGNYAIYMSGVGQLTRYNNIHSGSNIAVRYNGNDHVIEYNNIHYVCVDVTYCAAIYADADTTYRGIKIRYNHIHNVTRNAPGSHVFAVMLNHQVAAAEVTNNVFYNNEVHVYIGGGRDHVIEGNVMYNATAYSMYVNGQGKGNANTNLVRALHAMPYTGPLWKAKYPKLAAIDSYNYTLPEGNQIRKNLVFNVPQRAFLSGMNGWLDAPQYYNVTTIGFSDGPEDHYNTKIGDLRLRCHAAAWANQVGFQQVVTPNEVGPRYDVGPSFSKIGHKTIRLSNNPGSCPKLKPPNNNPPMPAYPPDGSGQPPIFKTFNEGCWLHLDKCANDTKAIGTYRDMIGERYFHAADNETMCFKRGYEQWKFCGSKANELVGVAYGPTGTQSYGGNGCLVATYGCPLHGGPADGHVMPGRVFHDTSAEIHYGAITNEEACLSHAKPMWNYCGSHPNHTVTMIFLRTGAYRTAGAGCWIETKHCAENPNRPRMFYDAIGATNYHSDDYEIACFQRAKDYWAQCGSDSRYPVTAHYRPNADSYTYPPKS